ncbi:MAG: GntR family transcriptional regulator [Anaerolineae bacterium]|nr:GntR family transcriptional regulator [Anaerolineae bacterium]
MTTLDRTSPVPLYFQLKQVLLGKIQQAEWQTGDLIPSEQELQEAYSLSRTTVRQTLADMVNEGWLHRERGRGTFVTRPKFAHDPVNRLSTTEFLLQQGITPGWRVLEKGWQLPLEDVAEKLKLSPDEELYRIHRLRLANDEPIGFHFAYVTPAIVPYINEAALTEGGSLRYLRTAPQMHNCRVTRTLEASAAQETEHTLLHMPVGSPVLLIERLITAEDGTPLELMWASYRGDRFKYQFTL